MKKFGKQILAFLLLGCMTLGSACGGGTETPEQPTGGNGVETEKDTPAPTQSAKPKEIVTIRYGTHYEQGLNPHYVDEVTGEYVMAENEREARLAAEQAILDELGVVFEYVQYSGDTREVLLQSVMANDPVCDIAVLWGGSEGTVLAQNVLQKIDDYAYIFQNDEECSWMLYDKLFGNYYLLGDVVRFNQRWPLVYNIDMVEAVDSLKDANGNTIYPNTLFEEGKWTWSTFKDYLSKIDAYYASDDNIKTYWSDHRFVALSAAYSAGGAIYGSNGLEVTSPAMKKAASFVKELLDAGYLYETLYDDGYTPEWCKGGEQFVYGNTVFTDIPDWYIGWAAGEASNRGQSIGIVPWPREDSLSADSEEYRQVITVGDSIGVPKGVPAEKVEIALKALALYTKTYYKVRGGVNSIAEYQDAYAMQQASDYGFDIFHEKIGDSILSSFQFITSKMPTGKDYSDLLGMRVAWDDILGKSYYGVEGYASYNVAVEANINKFSEIVDNMTAILSKEGVNDNVAPSVSKIQDWAVVPVGTTMTDEIWMQFISATDNAEGVMGIGSFKPEFNNPDTDSKVKVTYTEADLNKPGNYSRMFKAYFVDKAGNKGYCTVSVRVYDPDNTKAPTVTLKDAPETIELNTDVNTIDWAGKFIETAVDRDGVDVKSNVKADLSEIDSTKAGTYNVKLTVTDFAGNITEITVKATVK